MALEAVGHVFGGDVLDGHGAEAAQDGGGGVVVGDPDRHPAEGVGRGKRPDREHAPQLGRDEAEGFDAGLLERLLERAAGRAGDGGASDVVAAEDERRLEGIEGLHAGRGPGPRGQHREVDLAAADVAGQLGLVGGRSRRIVVEDLHRQRAVGVRLDLLGEVLRFGAAGVRGLDLEGLRPGPRQGVPRYSRGLPAPRKGLAPGC